MYVNSTLTQLKFSPSPFDIHGLLFGFSNKTFRHTRCTTHNSYATQFISCAAHFCNRLCDRATTATMKSRASHHIQTLVLRTAHLDLAIEQQQNCDMCYMCFVILFSNSFFWTPHQLDDFYFTCSWKCTRLHFLWQQTTCTQRIKIERQMMQIDFYFILEREANDSTYTFISIHIRERVRKFHSVIASAESRLQSMTKWMVWEQFFNIIIVE